MKLASLALLSALAAPYLVSSDHDRVRQAVEAGEILPLRAILERADADYPGQFVKAELEDEDGRLVYEIKVITRDGRVLELIYDARTAELIAVKGKRRR